MKIQQVAVKTGLKKRTIHFYISKNLVHPGVDKENGYFQFSAEDVQKLNIIHELRSLDFSLDDIRYILDHPNTAYYYMYKQNRRMEEEYIFLQEKLNKIEKLMEIVPINIDIQNFNECLHGTIQSVKKTKDKIIPRISSIKDMRLLNLYTFGIFLIDVTMTEYRQYLWEKLNKLTLETKDQNYIILNEFLLSLNPHMIEKLFMNRNQHVEFISHMTEEESIQYADEIYRNLHSVLNAPNLLNQWKTLYQPYFKPFIEICDSPISDLVRQISSSFSSYCKNIHLSCEIIRNRLGESKENKFLNELQDKLSGCIDIDHCHYAELEVLSTLIIYNYPVSNLQKHLIVGNVLSTK